MFSGFILWLDDVAETVDTRKERGISLALVAVAGSLEFLASCLHLVIGTFVSLRFMSLSDFFSSGFVGPIAPG